MLKGVNKQVLEINETESDYFEKAIFFVKPEFSGLSEGKLREIARHELEAAGKPPMELKLREKSKLLTVLLFAGVLLVGTFFGILLMSLGS